MPLEAKGMTILMNYGKILAKLRKEKKYNQYKVADYLSRHAKKPYSHVMVSQWENGYALPPVEQFLLMCELYDVVDIQKTFRGVNTNIPGYNKLNSLGQKRADEYISVLAENPKFNNDADFIVNEPKRKYIKRFDLPATAGTGNYLDNYSYTEIEVDETVPSDADFAVEVSGNSMMPRFIDGQTVFIKKQETLEIGEIGVFALNNDSFIKKLGHRELISLNPEYEPIPINELDSFHVFGKVVG